MNKYYSLKVSGREADVYIFGDITSWEWLENDVSSYTLAKEIEGLDVDVINVHINSYGGEVSEGWAIYNILKNHPAKVRTFCDGFACSIASVIFMAGDERTMSNVSLLFIHNAWTSVSGNADDLRKVADDIETMSRLSMEAYKAGLSISDEELKEMLDTETWITPTDALDMGFATAVTSLVPAVKASQNARKSVFELMTNGMIGADIIRETVKSLAESVTAEKDDASTPALVVDTDPNHPQDTPEPEIHPDPDPAPPKNKTMKFIEALLGGKD